MMNQAGKIKRLRLTDSFEKIRAFQMGKNLKKAKTTVDCMFAVRHILKPVEELSIDSNR